MTYFFALLLALQANLTGIQITILPSEEVSPENIQVTLKTYEYRDGEAFLLETQVCKTDSEGTCTLLLEKPDTTGMQRGTLQVGNYGTRDVTWPGGMLTLQIPLDRVGFGREAAPYDFQTEDGGVPVRKSAFPLYALLMGVFLVFLYSQIYRYAKTQEKN